MNVSVIAKEENKIRTTVIKGKDKSAPKPRVQTNSPDKGKVMKTSILKSIKRGEKTKKMKQFLHVAEEHLNNCDKIFKANENFFRRLQPANNDNMALVQKLSATLRENEDAMLRCDVKVNYKTLEEKISKFNQLSAEINKRLIAMNAAKNTVKNAMKSVTAISDGLDGMNKSNRNWRRLLSLGMKEHFDPQGLGGIGTYKGSYGRHER